MGYGKSCYPSPYLDRYGKSIRRISLDTGLAYMTVYNVLGKGQRPRSLETAVKLSEALNVPLDEMVRWGVSKPKEYLPEV